MGAVSRVGIGGSFTCVQTLTPVRRDMGPQLIGPRRCTRGPDVTSGQARLGRGRRRRVHRHHRAGQLADHRVRRRQRGVRPHGAGRRLRRGRRLHGAGHRSGPAGQVVGLRRHRRGRRALGGLRVHDAHRRGVGHRLPRERVPGLRRLHAAPGEELARGGGGVERGGPGLRLDPVPLDRLRELRLPRRPDRRQDVGHARLPASAGALAQPLADPGPGGRPRLRTIRTAGVSRREGETYPGVTGGLRMRRRTIVIALAALAVGGSALAPALASAPVVDPTVPAGREVEPVVLTGASFPQWAAPAEVTAKVPSVAGASCTSGDNTCTHNQYENPEVATGDKLGHGADVTKLLGYRWNAQHKQFEQIPFQVDEMATRYISNNASTFSVYSQTDQHPTPVFDEERFRWTKSSASDPCKAAPDGPPTTPDPVPGLDTNDEFAFMASDAGPEAPTGTALPAGIANAAKVTLNDPLAPGKASYVYVMLAGGSANAPAPAFNAQNGYVRYLADSDSDTFLHSQSAYGSYGNAAKGP